MPNSLRTDEARPVEAYRGWSVAFGITLALSLVVTLTPFYSDGVRGVVMNMFSFVCHQLPDRSPHFGDVSMAVCHRCAGIYWALPIAAVGYRVSLGRRLFARFRTLSIVAVAALPAGIDWLGDVAGLWVNTPVSRVVTGMIFGLVAGYVLAEGISDIARDARRKAPRVNTDS